MKPTPVAPTDDLLDTWAVPAGLKRLLAVLFAVFAVVQLSPDLPSLSPGLYVPAHTIIEVFAVVVASLVFSLGWNADHDRVPGATQVISCAFLSVALLDLGHLLSIQGMQEFVTPASAEKGIAFWLPARFIEAIALLVAATGAGRATRPRCIRPMLATSLVFTAAVFAVVLGRPEWLSRTFVEGKGLTDSKIGAEHAIVAVHMLTIVMLWRLLRRRTAFDVPGLLSAVAAMTMSELFFTRYSAEYDVYLTLGHIYKVIAYALVYRAVYVDAVRRPYLRLRAVEEHEREAIAAALEASESRFQTMADAVPCILYTRNADGTIDFVNRRAREYTGLDSRQLRTEWMGVVHPDDTARVTPSVRQAQSARTRYDMELRLRGADGSYRWFAGSAHPLVQEVPMRWFGALTDIEALKRHEAALRRNELELRQADQRKDEFLAILAHELRSPLAPLRTALEVLRRLGADDRRRVAAEEMMERQVRQMARLIDDLLDQSRLATGKLHLRQEKLDVRDVVDKAVEDVAGLIRTRRHVIVLDVSQEPLPVVGDLARLVQVVVNLLGNAAKYTEPEGRIVLHAHADGAHVSIRVEDDGIGIAPDDLERVFEMFTQLNGPPGHGGEGLGIGLHLARRIVELHGGAIGASSAGPGCGSTFTVRLPLVQDDAAQAQPQAHASPAPSGRRVLVVDDNADATDSLVSLLQLMGHEALAANSGAEALRLAEHLRPDLVLLDLGMPDMNGFEVARELRAKDWGADLAIVALSGWGQEADKRKSRDAGFDDHLTKPVAPEALEAILQRRVASGTATSTEG